ncbi:Peptidyl-tRNA hydrolase [Frankliniella fusca]|uniref:Peptidyl-tRNA hydrolase n=1 Tax=Frankliniella fusca TaxID=407009 RepID=A0AAE1LHF1_9NEOP|nr:Peptidyl-tRNA hydrolase [Frankliniella fusca]
MDSSTQSTSKDLNDGDILQILLKLSDINCKEWESQFPFLDSTTLSRVAKSVSIVLRKGKNDLKRGIVPLIKKWCTGQNKSQLLTHAVWVGRALTIEECVSSAISVCVQIFKDEDDWNNRDQEQQLAFSYAMLGAALNSPAPLHPDAGEMCHLIVDRMLKLREINIHHHRFLAQIWNSVGELQLTPRNIIQLAEKSFLGIEKMLLWLGRRAVSSNQSTPLEAFDTIVGSTFLTVCSQSSSVFQNVCDVLFHMMLISEAHPGIQSLTKSFVTGVETECKREGTDISVLYREISQVPSILLCLDPSLLPDNGKNVLSKETVVGILNELPKKEAACLLSHRPAWLLFTF